MRLYLLLRERAGMPAIADIADLGRLVYVFGTFPRRRRRLGR
jgi:hypothetical protein